MISKKIEELTDELLEDAISEGRATLTVEKGESSEITEDYDMLEVFLHNISENIDAAKKAIPMLSKKEAYRVLFRVLESGVIDIKNSKLRLRTNLEVNIAELCSNIEMDKRALVLKMQEKSYLAIPGVLELLEKGAEELRQKDMEKQQQQQGEKNVEETN